MYRAEIFLVTIVILIIFMLLYQAISFRITLKQNLCVTIEYFPLKILLFNFQKKKIKKEKLIKQTKRLLFFLSPLLKSVNFLLRKSEISVYNLSFSQNKSDEPHNYFIYREISALSKIYLYSLLNAISKNTNVATSDFSENQNPSTLDFQLETKLYNIFSSIAVLIFYSIKKKGKKKVVGK